jgi:hypothetical protein
MIGGKEGRRDNDKERRKKQQNDLNKYRRKAIFLTFGSYKTLHYNMIWAGNIAGMGEKTNEYRKS